MTSGQQKQLKLKTIKKCRLNFWASVILVLVLSLIKLVLANRSATWGRQLEQLNRETAAVKAANDQLKLELNQRLGGLDKIEQEALSLGFTAKPQYLYLPAGESVAQKRP